METQRSFGSTCLPLKQLLGMSRTTLVDTLMHFSGSFVPFGADEYRIPCYFGTGFASRAAEVLMFLDAAAKHVCGDSCATHDGVWLN